MKYTNIHLDALAIGNIRYWLFLYFSRVRVYCVYVIVVRINTRIVRLSVLPFCLITHTHTPFCVVVLVSSFAQFSFFVNYIFKLKLIDLLIREKINMSRCVCV